MEDSLWMKEARRERGRTAGRSIFISPLLLLVCLSRPSSAVTGWLGKK